MRKDIVGKHNKNTAGGKGSKWDKMILKIIKNTIHKTYSYKMSALISITKMYIRQ